MRSHRARGCRTGWTTRSTDRIRGLTRASVLNVWRGRHQVIAGLDPWDIGVNRSSGAVVAAATVHRTGRKCTPRSNDLYLPCFKPWLFGTP